MGAADLEILRTFELRLLRCSLSAASVGNNERTPHHYKELEQKQNSLLRLIEDVVNSIESGNYIQALSSDAVRLIFEFSASWDFHDSIDCADRFYSEVEKSVVAFLRRHSVLRPEEEGDWLCRAFLVMCIAVAAFLAFTQANLTGPLDGLPSFPLSFRLSNDNKAVTVGAEWDIWARNHLMSTGSDLLGKFSAIQYIVYAKLLLMKTKDMFVEENISSLDGIRSISWWLARLILIQQRILDERSSSLFDILQVLMGETLEHFGDFGEVTSYWGSRFHEEEASTIVSTAHLEAGVMEYIYGRVDSSRVHFKSAEEASRLQLSVTGVLGFRTVHQEEAKAQMVLIPNMSMSKGGGIVPTINSEVQRDVYGLGENKVAPHPCATSEASDILMTPRLIDNKNFGIDGAGIHQNGNDSVSLEAIQQAVILVQCLLIEKSTPYSEMQRWEMAPYIEAIDAQRFSCFIIQRFCDILRIRWESTRGRTKERAVMMMDKLVQDVYEPPPGVAERIMFCYGVCVPTIPALRKEYGELLVSCGMMGEAIKIFEDLELWDNLIYCYCLLEKKAAAVDLIKLQLSKMPNDPRLWCSLGDVTNDDACYEKALEVSNNRSARAKRSLARSAYNKGDYETSKILWESALTLNSLYPDGWFALGAAALKARDIDKALDAFTRAVQLDPENGEAWNNIACLHMIKKRSKEAFIAFKEALKFRRNSWQLWENYSQVAVDISNFSQALEATKMVLDLTGNKRIDADLLERIMLEMEGRTFTSDTISPVANFGHNCCTEIQIGNFSAGVVGSGETGLVMELLGKVLQQAVRSGGGRDNVWGLYARWHKIKGDLAMCSEALLKQVRSYQGADLWKDGDRFKKFARASLQLCKVYMEISSSTTSNRELTAAEMHLRNTVKQAVIFSDTEEFKELQSCLNEIKLLQANSVPSTECSS